MTTTHTKSLSPTMKFIILLALALATGLGLVLASKAVDLVEVFEAVHGGAH